MQVTVEEVSGLTKKLTVVLPADMVDQRLDDAYNELKSDVSIKGFRKGKVPKKFLEKSYGPKVKQDVAEKMIQDSYFDALEESKLDAVVHPEVKTHEYTDDGSFRYEAEIDVKPEFELGDYKELEVELEEISVDDEDINQTLLEIQKQMAPLKSITDREVMEGDVVVLDFQGYHNGEEMKQVKGENYTVDVGSDRNGKEFEENLIGLKKSEETTREIDFPAGFSNPVLADKKIQFKMKVQDIKERSLAVLDDEFAKDVDAKFNTLDDLKEHIKTDKLKRVEDDQKAEMADKIMQQLIDKHDFDVPKRLVIYEAEMMVKQMEQNLTNQGMSLESTGLSKDKLAQNYLEPAGKRVKGDFIIKQIAENENIKLADEDIEAGFNRVANQYNMKVDEVKQFFQAREDLMPFMNELLNEKVLEHLRESTSVKRISAEELEKRREEATKEAEETAAK